LFIAFVSASRLVRRELEVVNTTQIVCANWFGNNLNWDNIPFQEMAPWGLTPQGCTEAIVEPYGEYSCATYDNNANSFQVCSGDCFDGVCVNGYATQEPSVVCYPGTAQDGTNCIPCAAGSYNAIVGGECIPCPVGTYASESGSVACKPCEVGYFVSSTGSQSCDLCQQGYTTNGYGQTECVLAATEEPTLEPTDSPTVAPTQVPSESPVVGSPSRSPSRLPTVHPSTNPTAGSTSYATPTVSFNVLYQNAKLTCHNGGQKISQPCNGGRGTGCSYDTCVQHCIDESQCNFFFSIDGTKGCILYSSCDQTRVPYYSGTTVEVTRSPTVAPTLAPTQTPSVSLNVLYQKTRTTCHNAGQKISQPCNGGRGTGCNYDACVQHCIDESQCNFFFSIDGTKGCILYSSCDQTRVPYYSGTTVEIKRSPTVAPTIAPTQTPNVSLNVLYQNTRLTCHNGGQKISQPCNGGRGTGCSYNACVQHCIDESQCNFFFSIDGTNGCILYSGCDQTRVPYYSGTTVEITRN